MANCSKCGNQDMEWKEGVGKSTGKPWKAWFCKPCKLMHGMNGQPWGDKSAAPKPTGNAESTKYSHQEDDIINKGFANINKKLDLILSKIGVQDKDDTPF